MPSKIPPISFRPGTARRIQIDAWRAERGLTYTEAVRALIDLGLGDPAPKNEKSGRALVAAKQKPSRDRWNLKAAGVHFGPVKPELGSRLRGAKK